MLIVRDKVSYSTNMLERTAQEEALIDWIATRQLNAVGLGSKTRVYERMAAELHKACPHLASFGEKNFRYRVQAMRKQKKKYAMAKSHQEKVKVDVMESIERAEWRRVEKLRMVHIRLSM